MKRMLAVVLAVALAGVLNVGAVENKGAENIDLDGGDRGVVHFPHYRHQNTLGDCNICHSLFPEKPGSIERLIKDGKLVPKQIMNKHCIKCHKSKKREGLKAGPVTCSKCHEKG